VIILPLFIAGGSIQPLSLAKSGCIIGFADAFKVNTRPNRMTGISRWRGNGCSNQLTALQRVGLGYARSIRTSFSGR
jgi:hypothetical protein